jgi:type I restriction enzyme, S subunit
VKETEDVRLGDVCSISSALVDPRLPEYLDLLHVGGANIESKTGRMLGLKTSQEEGLKSGKFLFDERMVLYSKIRPYLEKVVRPDFQGICSADIYPLTPVGSCLDRDYLFHLLLTPTFTDYAVAGSARAGMPKVNRDHLFAFQFRLPSLRDQRRIVAILDESFAAIATARANTEHNLLNAREVFLAHLNAVFVRGGKGWKSENLGAVARISYGYTESASTEPVGPRFLRITDLKDNSVDWGSVPYCKIASGDAAKYALADGDIVFARTGATTGKSFRVKDPPASVFASYLIRVRLHRLGLLPEFVHLFFQSEVYWRAVEQGVTGSTQGGFNASKLALLSIPVPPLEDQHRLVAAFNRLFVESRRLESVGQRKLTALDALKQSLLHQVFRGAL